MGLDMNVCIYTPTYTSKPGFPGGSVVKSLLAMQHTQVQSLGWEHPLEEGMATHSNILAWKIQARQRSLAGYSP